MRIASLTIMIFFLASALQAQKISKNIYKNIDTIYQYDNAAILIYKQNGKYKRDTIFFSVTKNWHVDKVGEMSIYNGEKLKK